MKRNFVFLALLAFLMPILLLGGYSGENSSEQNPVVFTYSTHGNNGFDTNLVSILPDGTEKRRITVDSLDNHAPLYSPDGKHIAFLSAKSGATELYLLDTDGNNERKITSEINEDRDNFVHFLWMPDSQHIVLEINSQWQVLSIATGKLQPYSNWESSPSFYPISFSHDGLRLLYISSSQLRVRDEDGANDYALTGDTLESFSAFWSPDDTQVIFTARRTSQNDVKGTFYIVNVDGTSLTEIFEDEFDLPIPFALSSDGEKIAFYVEPSFSILDLKRENVVELFKTEYPDYIGSITWQP